MCRPVPFAANLREIASRDDAEAPRRRSAVSRARQLGARALPGPGRIQCERIHIYRKVTAESTGKTSRVPRLRNGIA
ncbi:hypothetical protein SB861_47365 [Paraburkholderia sp. SIMBA_049]